jgi:hypothetical protein
MVSGAGQYMLVWKKGIAVLAAGPTKVTPDNRIRLVDGYNLEISNVQTQDAGDYACQIATLQPIEIIHTVEILGEYSHVTSQVRPVIVQLIFILCCPFSSPFCYNCVFRLFLFIYSNDKQKANCTVLHSRRP